MDAVIALLNESGRWLVAQLGRMSVELAILAGIVLVALYVLRVKSPALRHLFWGLLLAKPVVTFLVASPLSLYAFLWPAIPEVFYTPAPVAVQMKEAPVEPPLVAVSTPDASSSIKMQRPEAAPFWRQIDRYGLASAIWVLVASLLGLRLLLGCAYVAFLRSTARTQREGPLAQLAAEAGGPLRMRRCVHVATTRVAHGPVLAGILRPVILLPESMAKVLTPKQLKLVITHELAHARRWDNLVLLVQRLAEMFFFFHPVVWFCGWVMRREAEAACDDMVVSAYGNADGAGAAAYADSLIRVAEMKCGITRRLLVNTFAAAESNFARRIQRILSGRRTRMTLWLSLATGVALVVIGALGLPTVSSAPIAEEVARTIRVVSDGQPVAGAEVAVTKPGWWLFFNNGAFREAFDHRQQAKMTVVKTDAAGQFSFPDIDGPFVIAIAHPSGYAIVNRETLGSGAIALTPWGSVEGRLRLSGVVCAGTLMAASAVRGYDKNGRPANDSVGYNDASFGEGFEVHFSSQVKTDAEGRYVLQYVPAGDASVSPAFDFGDGSSGGVIGLHTTVAVAVGHTTTLAFGDNRSVVTGKLKSRYASDPRIDWTLVKADLMLEAPHVGMSGDEKLWEAHGKFARSDKGRLYFRDVPVSADGSFRIKDVPEGRFLFRVFVPPAAAGLTDSTAKSIGQTSCQFTLPVPEPQSTDAPLDLGVMEIALVVQSASDSNGQRVTVPVTDGLDSKAEGISAVERPLDKPIFFSFDNTRLPEIIAALVETSGVNIVTDNRVAALQSEASGGEGLVSHIEVKDVSLREALRQLLDPYGLDYRVLPGFIWISTPLALHTESFEDLETRYYTLPRGRNVDEIVNLLKQAVPDVFEPGTGKTLSNVVWRAEAGQLVVHNTPSNCAILEGLLAQMPAVTLGANTPLGRATE